MSYSYSDKKEPFYSQEPKFAAFFSRSLSLYGSEEWQLKGGDVLWADGYILRLGFFDSSGR